MKEVTLVIPAKKEPNALPIVLNELKNHYPNINIIINNGENISKPSDENKISKKRINVLNY